MNMWTMIVIVVMVGCCYSAWEAWLKHQAKAAGALAADARAELDAMRARIEALEAIVTDSEYDLKRRIDDLAEPPRRSVG